MRANDLYQRGLATLIASWEAYARGACGAAVLRQPGVISAVFPFPPERDVYNNAVLQRDLTAVERTQALEAMEAAYAAAGVNRFAAWVHESDVAMREEVERRGYAFDSATRAMGMGSATFACPDRRSSAPNSIGLAICTWSGYGRTSCAGPITPPST